MPMDKTELRHRLLAILAADASGYSRLMAINDLATVAELDAARGQFRAQVAASGGRIIDTAGDSALAVFDSAVGAVTAALAVQKELAAISAGVPVDRRMHFRIGVHLGDVIEKADGTVYGDGVNIAARLQGLADPGGVTAVSAAIHGAVRGRVDTNWVDAGEQDIKNIPYPVRAYRIDTRTRTGSGSDAGAEAAPRAQSRRWAPRWVCRGRIEEGIERARYGMRISPRDRRLGFWGWALGWLLLRAKRADEALQEARTSAGHDPRLHLTRILEAAALQQLGRGVEARAALAAARRIRPGLMVQEIEQSHGRRVANLLGPLWQDG